MAFDKYVEILVDLQENKSLKIQKGKAKVQSPEE